jgi:hypothetical protein
MNVQARATHLVHKRSMHNVEVWGSIELLKILKVILSIH